MLYLLQGPPGSGKSTLAREIQKVTKLCSICSTDHYFMVNGEYVFDKEKLGEYHAMNLQDTIDFLKAGWNVIVDNCNIRQEHVQPYIDFANKNKIPIAVIRLNGRFKNIHNVPEEIVERMREGMCNISTTA